MSKCKLTYKNESFANANAVVNAIEQERVQNLNQSDLFKQISEIPFLNSEKDVLDVFTSQLSDKAQNADIKHPSGEPKLVYATQDGYTESFKDILVEGVDVAEMGYIVDDKFVKVLEYPLNRDLQTADGVLFDLMQNGIVHDAKVRQGNDYVYRGGGHRLAYNQYNLHSAVLRLQENLQVTNLKIDTENGIFTYDVYDPLNPIIVNDDGSTTQLTTEEFDKQIAEGTLDQPNIGAMILNRLAADGKHIFPVRSNENKETDTENVLFAAITNFLKDMGITTMSLEEYKRSSMARNGVEPDAAALADIANKIIAIKDRTNTEGEFVEEVSHFLVEAFSDQNAVDEALASIPFTSEYMEHQTRYRAAYERQGAKGEELENLVRREVLGKILAKHLQGKMEATSTESGSILQTLKTLLKDFIERLQSLFTPSHQKQIDALNRRIASALLAKDSTNFDESNLYNSRYTMYSLENLSPSFRQAINNVNSAKKAIAENFNAGNIGVSRDPLDVSNDFVHVDAYNTLYTLVGSLESEVEFISEELRKARAEGTVLSTEAGYSYTAAFNTAKALKEAQAILEKEDLDLLVTEYEAIVTTTEAEERAKNKAIRELERVKRDRDVINKAAYDALENMNRIEGEFASYSNSQAAIEDAVMSNSKYLNFDNKYLESMVNAGRKVWKDVNMFASYFGAVGNRQHPMLQFIRDTIGIIMGKAQHMTNQRIKPFVKWAIESGAEPLLKNLIERDSKGKKTGNYISMYNTEAYKEAWEEFELTTKAGIVGMQIPADWKELRQADLTLNADQMLDYIRARNLKKREFTEMPLSDSVYQEIENLRSGIESETRQYLDNLSAQRGAIRGRYRDANGVVDHTKMSVNDLKRLDQLYKQDQLRKSPYDDNGNLKVGLKMQGDEIVPDDNPALVLDRDDIITRDLVRIQNRQKALFDARPSRTANRQFLDKVRELEGIDPEAALNFITLNGGITFTDDFWDSFGEVGYLDSVKAEIDATTDPIVKLNYEDALEKYEALLRQRRKYLKASKKPNNPAEIEASHPHKILLKKIESELHELRSELPQIPYSERGISESETTLNNDYFQELQNLGIQVGSEAELEFLKANMINAKADNLGSLGAKARAFKRTGMESKFVDAYIGNLDPASPTFVTDIQLRYARENVLSYYKRTAPRGYDQMLTGIKEGRILVSDLVEGTGSTISPYLKVVPNFDWADDNGTDNTNSKYDPDGVAEQPKRIDRFLNDEFFTRYGISKEDFKSGRLKFEDMVATRNQLEFEALKRVTQMRYDSLKATGDEKLFSRFSMPKMSRNIVEKHKSFFKGGTSAWKAALKDLVQFRPDELEGGEMTDDNISYSEFSEMRVIPKFYRRDLDDMDDLSEDILHMATTDYKAAALYSARKENQNKIMLAMTNLQRSKISNKNAANSNTLKMAKEYTDAMLYGMQYNYDFKVNILGKEINLSKFLNTINNYVRHVNLAWNPFVDLTGATTMFVTRKTLEQTQEYYGKSSLKAARKVYRQNIMPYLRESGKVNKTSLMNNILEFTGLESVEDRTDFGSNNRLVRLLYKSDFGLSKVSNLTGTPQIALSTLMDFRWANGGFISHRSFMEHHKETPREEAERLWDSLENNSMYHFLDFTGEVTKVSERFKDVMTTENGWDLSDPADLAQYESFAAEMLEKMEISSSQKIRKIVSIVDGVSNTEDRVMAQRNPILNFIMTHTSWLSIIIDRRFKGRHYSAITDTEEAGHYRVIGEFLGDVFREWRTGGQNGNGMPFWEAWRTLRAEANKDSALSTAMETFRVDALFTLLTSMIGFLALALSKFDMEDDEENGLLQLGAYTAIRTVSENTSLSPVGVPIAIMDKVKNPLVMMSYLEEFGKLFQGGKVVKSGTYKGWTKAEQSLAKMTYAKRIVQLMNMNKTVETYQHYNTSTLLWLGENKALDKAAGTLSEILNDNNNNNFL
jgi:hypothetical protein